jgi:hypothetical protein
VEDLVRLDERILAECVPAWKAGLMLARSRQRGGWGRTKMKGASVDQILARHGITWRVRGPYLAYEREIRRRVRGVRHCEGCGLPLPFGTQANRDFCVQACKPTWVEAA